jgi:low affinity Fe/Cu permease
MSARLSPTKQSQQSNHQSSDKKKRDFFSIFASQTARLSGTSHAFVWAVGIIVVWGLTGPLFKFSDTWQLVINTGTTIITFLMVFLIQNTQNRDSEAMHLKIDELIRATRGAKNALIDLEDMTQDELDAFKVKFAELANKSRKNGKHSTGDILEKAMEETVSLTAEETKEVAKKAKQANRQ